MFFTLDNTFASFQIYDSILRVLLFLICNILILLLQSGAKKNKTGARCLKKFPLSFFFCAHFCVFLRPTQKFKQKQKQFCFLRTLWPLAYYNFLRPTLNCSCSVFKYLSFFTQCVFSESAFLVYYSKRDYWSASCQRDR